MAFKFGDRVAVKTRTATEEDEKSGLYFNYFGGLVGSVDKVYDDGTMCLDIELDSLTDEMRKRHLAMQDTERRRWLKGLSGEVRNRLSAEQRQLAMSYRILVNGSDLEKFSGPKADQTKWQQQSADDDDESDTSERMTEEELAAKEEEHLREKQQNS